MGAWGWGLGDGGGGGEGDRGRGDHSHPPPPSPSLVHLQPPCPQPPPHPHPATLYPQRNRKLPPLRASGVPALGNISRKPETRDAAGTEGSARRRDAVIRGFPMVDRRECCVSCARGPTPPRGSRGEPRVRTIAALGPSLPVLRWEPRGCLRVEGAGRGDAACTLSRADTRAEPRERRERAAKHGERRAASSAARPRLTGSIR